MLRGSCFYLRHPKKEEIPQLIHLLNDLDARGPWLPTELMLPGQLEKRFEEQHSSKENMEYFLIIGDDEQILGRVFHFKTVPYFQSREIGYSLFSTAFHGKGIMSEAVALLTRYLFETTLLNRLEIHMEAGNTGSEKVAINNGFQFEGIARGAGYNRGRFVDVRMYALLRSEWEALQSA